jgi:putative ABC transport system ATP-binding protein
VIELLGIGVRDRGGWCLRRVSARVEGRALVAVISERRDQRVTLLDVIAGRLVPCEGRAWIDGTPLSEDTACRVRARVGVMDLATPLALGRTAAWNVLGGARARRLGGFAGLARRGSPQVAMTALQRVGLEAAARIPVADLDPRARVGVVVARALHPRPAHLVVVEPDTYLPADEVPRLFELLRSLVDRDRLSIFVSLADPSLARETSAMLSIPGREAA